MFYHATIFLNEIIELCWLESNNIFVIGSCLKLSIVFNNII